jgi:ketosteroid isomerase-like protein
MKYLAIRFLVALSTFFIGISASALLSPLRFDAVSNGEAKQEILQLERRYIQAHLERDVDALDDILADEFTIRGRWGRVTTKARRLALLENPDFAFAAINTDNVQVEVNGESATVTGNAFIRSRYEDEEQVSPTYRFKRRYEKRDGRWQVVSVRIGRSD